MREPEGHTHTQNNVPSVSTSDNLLLM